jgi:DNA-binding NtrC family response regulator
MTASRILVVDDEADIRGLLKEILSEEGYEVEVAADAGQARFSRATQVPDLVLLDIWMPDTDGITLLREWSVTDGYDCPVVMMSGHGTVETAVEATRLGAFDFVEKPLSLTKLLRTVERALDAGRVSGCRSAARVRAWRCPSARVRSRRRCANKSKMRRRAPRRCYWRENWDRGARPMRGTCIP